MALASVQYQRDKIDYFELGNEPTNYPSSRWNFSTDAYVAQWKQWTSQIDAAVNEAVGANESSWPSERWWASSATTDQTGLHVRPADIIPAGINSENQVAQYQFTRMSSLRAIQLALRWLRYPISSTTPACSATPMRRSIPPQRQPWTPDLPGSLGSSTQSPALAPLMSRIHSLRHYGWLIWN